MRHSRLAVAGLLLAQLLEGPASADAVTEWNQNGLWAAKGFNGHGGGTGQVLNSNLTTRILAIQARAMFDAINAITHFSARSYHFSGRHHGGYPRSSSHPGRP
jgi:hypothetical protein